MTKFNVPKKKALVIFPGWASVKSLYEDYIPWDYDIIYVDFFDKKRLENELKGYTKINFFAWSLGSILAIKWSQELNLEISKNILVSPTLNFTKTTPPVVIKKMIRDLNRNKRKVLDDFIKMNFYDSDRYKKYMDLYSKEIYRLDKSYLKDGLNILLEEKLQLLDNDTKTLFITSKKDKIIPEENSLMLLEGYGNITYKSYKDCGHNILYEKKYEMEKLIRSFLNDRERFSS